MVVQRNNEKDQTGMTFVTVCGGTFTMGSDKEKMMQMTTKHLRHPVTLSTFEISKTEITNAQYQQFKKDHEGNDNLPVSQRLVERGQSLLRKLWLRVAHRSRMGVCRPWRQYDAVGRLAMRRKNSATMRGSLGIREDQTHPVGNEGSKSSWALRYARQRMGVGRRLL